MSSKVAQEVPALIAAVTEHQRFRQLACYSIECLSKVIDPTNRDYERNLAVAHSCGAGKCVVDVLKRHPGKEDVLLICCESLEKLAVDDANSEVIAGEGCVEAILASLEANPEFPEHVLGQALSILDRLCDHKKSLHILVERESIRSLIKVLNTGNQKTEVLVSCLKGMAKLTRVAKASADFQSLQGTPPTLGAMSHLASSVSMIATESIEQSGLFSGVALFIRLLQQLKKDDVSENAFKDTAEEVKAAGGQEFCLQVMDKSEDEPLSKACSKLLSLLFDSSSIEQLIQSMSDGSLSMEMQHHVLHMLASLAVDPVSSTDIVRFGGVSVLIKSSELNLSVKLLDMSVKALLYLSSNVKNVAQMVNDGAIEELIRIIMSPLEADLSVTVVNIYLDVKANAVMALKNICVVSSNIPQACKAKAVEAMVFCLSSDVISKSLQVSLNALSFLELLMNSSANENEVLHARNGSSNGLLKQHIRMEDMNVLRVVMSDVFPDEASVHVCGMRVLYDLSIASSEYARHLVGSDMVTDIISGIEEFGNDNVAVLHACLHLLWTLLIESCIEVTSSVTSAHNNTGIEIVLGSIGRKIRVEAIRKVGVEVIGLLASEALVVTVVDKLNKIAAIPSRDLNEDVVGDVSMVAISIGVLAMIPSHLKSIFTLGGVAPIISLLSNIMLMPMQSKEEGASVYHDALTTLCSALEEIISSSNILEVPNLLETIKACINVLQKHSKLLSIVQPALRLLTVISSSSEKQHKVMCIENNVLEAVSNILRSNPSNIPIVRSITKIFANFTTSEDDVAIVICRRNASKHIITCIEKNLQQVTSDGTINASTENETELNINAIHRIVAAFLPILYRLASILPEGRDILRRQNTLSCMCDSYHKFYLLQSLDDHHQADFENVKESCLKIIRLLLDDGDILEALNSLRKKKESTRPGLFSLTDRSVDVLNAASQDVLRLGLLMLCGENVVHQVEEAGGVSLIHECLYNFSPSVNKATCESSLVTRARDKFVNYCIEALGRAALGHLDVEATIAIIPLLVAAAVSNPTVAVFVAMTHLGRLHESVAQGLVDAGAVQACLSVCQAETGVYSAELVTASYTCLSLLAGNKDGLQLIVNNNAVSLICQFIMNSLRLFEDEREFLSSSSSVYLDEIRSALAMLLALVSQYDTSTNNGINVDILQVVCELIDVFVLISADAAAHHAKSKASSLSSFMVLIEDADMIDAPSACSQKPSLFPDLLAVCMNIVKALIEGRLGDEYCTALIQKRAIRKLDSLMYANEDAYLLVHESANALGSLWHVLVVDNMPNVGPGGAPPPPPRAGDEYPQASSREYINSSLQSREYILRAMNYHSNDMALQKVFARIVSCLGVDGSESGLSSFVEKIYDLLSRLSGSVLSELLQLLQLLGNLLLVDDMLSQELGESVFHALLDTFKRVEAYEVDSVVENKKLEVLKACLTCLSKLLAIDDPSTFALSDVDMELFLEFVKFALENSSSEKETKSKLLFLLQEAIEKTSCYGTGTYISTCLCLKLNILKPLLWLDLGEQSDMSFRIGAEEDSLKQQQESIIACLFRTVFEENQQAYLLYGENGYLHTFCVTDFLCCTIAQNNPSSHLYWKHILQDLLSEQWHLYFGSQFLLVLLSELLTPSPLSAGLRSENCVGLIRTEILQLLIGCVNSGALSSIEDPSSAEGLVKACSLEMRQLSKNKDASLVVTEEAQLFTLLSVLADSPVGAREITLDGTVRTWVMDMLVKKGEMASYASDVVTKLLYHEDMEVVETLVQQKLTKRILMSLKSEGLQDEALAQNGLYLLRVLADFLSISALELPKDTIKLLSDLMYTYSSNEYLIGVATSLKNDLLEMFAVGPEAQLEQLLATVPDIHAGAEGWVQAVDDNGYAYYYNSSDSTSQWEPPAGYSQLLRTLDEIVELSCRTLKNDLSNVAITEQHVHDFYQILLYQGTDVVVLEGMLQFLFAQVTCSGPSIRTLLNSLSEELVEVIVAAIYSQIEMACTDDSASSTSQMEQSLQIMENLLLLDAFSPRLSGEEYIRLMCEACRKFMDHATILAKAFSAIGRLVRKSAELTLIAFKYEFHLIMGEVVQFHTNDLHGRISTETADFKTFLSELDNNSGLLCNSLGNVMQRKSSVTSFNTEELTDDANIQESKFMPVLHLMNLVLSLCHLLLGLDSAEIVSILSDHCFSSLLLIGKSFMLSTTMVHRHLQVISRFASKQPCLQTIVTSETVSHLIAVISQHIDNIQVIKSALVLFSKFAAIEDEEAGDEEAEFSAAAVILDAGGFSLIEKVIETHMNKPLVLIVCMEVVFNLVEPGSVEFFSDPQLSQFYDVVFSILNRYDFQHDLVLSALQACVQFTSHELGTELIFGSMSSGRMRMDLLWELCHNTMQDSMRQRRDSTGMHPHDTNMTEALSTQESILLSVLEVMNATVTVAETVDLLQTSGNQESSENDSIQCILLILSTYSQMPALVNECLTLLLAMVDIDDGLSKSIGEKGSLLFINLVEIHIDSASTVSVIFQLFGRLVFIKENLMSFVQHRGIGLLMSAIKVYDEDADITTSAVNTLGNIVSSDEESSHLVLEAGAEGVIKQIQEKSCFQPPNAFPELHSATKSALLSIAARLRAKERVGTKTNVGTLLSRMGQDVNSVVNSEQDKVKASSLDMTMEDPLLPAYRSALKSGQNLTDYVKGTPYSRKMWLTSDCAHLILKEDTNNIKKLGRKIKLQHIAEVHKGLGPGHYKSGLLGGKKTKAKEDRSLFLTVSDKAPKDDEVTVEFSNSTDCNKWFQIFSALLTASVKCPHYLQEL